MNITNEQYITAKRLWNELKFDSILRQLTDEERASLRENYAIVVAYEEANK